MDDKDELIKDIVEQLKRVEGVEALVLGGSRARGTHTPASDIDLGIYYHPERPLDLGGLAEVAKALDDEHREGLVTEIGGWGPWINGGGWLRVRGTAVDFLYRDLEKVERLARDACVGRFEMAYQPGHPQGFPTFLYLAEAALCQPLWDPNGSLARLKALTQPYPPALKRAVINTFWWEADFSLKICHKSISRGDTAYAAGCCFRSVVCLMQTLFAVNETYWMNEKGAVALAAGFAKAPAGLEGQVNAAFAALDGSAAGIAAALDGLQVLLDACAPWVEAER